MEFKIDTGADVGIISESTYKALNREMSLMPASKSLTGPSCQPLNDCGQFTGTLRHGACTSEEFVMKTLQMSLLGHPAIEALGLVSRVNTVGDQRQHNTVKYSDLFQGLGKIPGTHHIQLNACGTSPLLAQFIFA